MTLKVYKAARRLEMWDGDRLALAAPVQLGFGADDGPKCREGDGRTPEGAYYICSRNPQSKYRLSLGISYPGPADAERGLLEGIITKAERDGIVEACAAGTRPDWNTALGGWIMIHGQPADGPREGDWTAGCIAVEDVVIRQIYDSAQPGDAVILLP